MDVVRFQERKGDIMSEIKTKRTIRTSDGESEAKVLILDLTHVSIPISEGFTGEEGIDMYGGNQNGDMSTFGLQIPMVRKGGRY
jgi:hypothetical protein